MVLLLDDVLMGANTHCTGMTSTHHLHTPQQINVTLPNMPCEWISIDALDISGDVQLDMVLDDDDDVLVSTFVST